MNLFKTIIINIARVLLGLTFIFSGFVKAVDPIGTQIKLQDYAEALNLLSITPDWLTLSSAVGLAAVEFTLGVMLLFAIRRRIITKVILLFMAVMTAITVWIWIADPVSDCGCFGDAVKLTNGETLLKNIVLLACAALTTWRPKRMPRMVSRSNQWIVFHYTIIFVIGISLYSLYFLPIFDFRPYHIGANIPQGMEIPEGAEQPEFETTFIMEKDGKQQEFTLENYPDSTWTFIDSKTNIIKEGYVPPIHDFSLQALSSDQKQGIEEGDDITDIVLSNPGYTFLLVSPHLETADDSQFGLIDQIYEYAQDRRYPFYCLTASGEEAIEHWKDITGAEYPFCNTDETTLKTIIRSNPGLLLLKNGTIIGKWSHNELPAEELLAGKEITDNASFLPQGDETGKKIAYLLLWYVLPLILLVLADRLWMWSQWMKNKEIKHSNRFFKHFKTKKENGKENCSR